MLACHSNWPDNEQSFLLRRICRSPALPVCLSQSCCLASLAHSLVLTPPCCPRSLISCYFFVRAPVPWLSETSRAYMDCSYWCGKVYIRVYTYARHGTRASKLRTRGGCFGGNGSATVTPDGPILRFREFIIVALECRIVGYSGNLVRFLRMFPHAVPFMAGREWLPVMGKLRVILTLFSSLTTFFVVVWNHLQLGVLKMEGWSTDFYAYLRF